MKRDTVQWGWLLVFFALIGSLIWVGNEVLKKETGAGVIERLHLAPVPENMLIVGSRSMEHHIESIGSGEFDLTMLKMNNGTVFFYVLLLPSRMPKDAAQFTIDFQYGLIITSTVLTNLLERDDFQIYLLARQPDETIMMVDLLACSMNGCDEFIVPVPTPVDTENLLWVNERITQ